MTTTELDLSTDAGRAAFAAMGQKRRSKYNNKRTPTDAGMADSQVEAARWAELRLMERAGQITALRFHPRYDLPGGVRYEGDSEYVEGGRVVCEDVKGRTAPLTQAFRIMAKLFRATYPDIELRIERR